MPLSPRQRENVKRLRNMARETRFGVLLGIINQPHLLALAYGSSDKATHRYMQYYSRHLGPLRFQRNAVLEIGVGGIEFDKPAPGGSLRIWRDYLIRSQIIGVDIHPKDVDMGHRVHFHRADQSSPKDLQRVIDRLGVPNVVIDDGSHLGDHQVAAFRFLFPRMPPGSVYVIEDLSTSYYPEYLGGIPAPEGSGIGFIRHLVDSVQARDPYFGLRPELGPAPPADISGIGAIHIYPGIAFVEKAALDGR
jgi:hypothetical protein